MVKAAVPKNQVKMKTDTSPKTINGPVKLKTDKPPTVKDPVKLEPDKPPTVKDPVKVKPDKPPQAPEGWRWSKRAMSSIGVQEVPTTCLVGRWKLVPADGWWT